MQAGNHVQALAVERYGNGVVEEVSDYFLPGEIVPASGQLLGADCQVCVGGGVVYVVVAEVAGLAGICVQLDRDAQAGKGLKDPRLSGPVLLLQGGVHLVSILIHGRAEPDHVVVGAACGHLHVERFQRLGRDGEAAVHGGIHGGVPVRHGHGEERHGNRAVDLVGGRPDLSIAFRIARKTDGPVSHGGGGGGSLAVAPYPDGLYGAFVLVRLQPEDAVELVVGHVVFQAHDRHGNHLLIARRAAPGGGAVQHQGGVAGNHIGVAAQGIAGGDSPQGVGIAPAGGACVASRVRRGDRQGGGAALACGGIGGGAGIGGGGVALLQHLLLAAAVPLDGHAFQVGAVGHRIGDRQGVLPGEGEGVGQGDDRFAPVRPEALGGGGGGLVARVVPAGGGDLHRRLAVGRIKALAQIGAGDVQVIGIAAAGGQGEGGLLGRQGLIEPVAALRRGGTVGDAVHYRGGGVCQDIQRDLLLAVHTGAVRLIGYGEGEGDGLGGAVRADGDVFRQQGHRGSRHIQTQLLHRGQAHGGVQRIARHVAQGAAVGGFQGDDADGIASVQGHPVGGAEEVKGQDGAGAHVVDVVHGVGYAAEAHLNGGSVTVLHIEDGRDAAFLVQLGVALSRTQPHFFIQGEGEGQVVPRAGPGGGGGDVLRPVAVGVGLIALGHVARGVEPGIAGGHVVQIEPAFQLPAGGPAEGVACQVGDLAVDGKTAHVQGCALLVQQLQIIAAAHPGLLAGADAYHCVVHVLPTGHGVGEDQLVLFERGQLGLHRPVGALAGLGADKGQGEGQILVHATGESDRLAHFHGEVEGLPALVGGAAYFLTHFIAEVDSGEGGRCRIGEIDVDLAHLGAAAGAVGGAHAEAEVAAPGGEHAAAGVGAGHPVRVVGAVAHLHNGGGVVAGIQIGLGPVGQVIVRAYMHMPVRGQRGADGGGDLHGGEQRLHGLAHVGPLVGGPPLAVLTVHIGAGGVENRFVSAADADSVLLRCQFGKVAVHVQTVCSQHIGADKAAVIGRLGGKQVSARHVGRIAGFRRPGGQRLHQGQNKAQCQEQTEPAPSSFHSSNLPFSCCLLRSIQRQSPSDSVSSVHSPCTK